MDSLFSFLDSKLIPELHALEQSIASEDSTSAQMHRHFLVDDFLWLHLGAEIGSFSVNAAQEIISQYLKVFFESLKASEPNERSGSPTSFANHSEESWAIVLVLPHFAGILIEKAMRGDKDLLSSQSVVFREPNKLTSVFQSLLLLHDHLQHDTVRAFIHAVNLAAPEEWSSVWRGEVSSEEVIEAQAADFHRSTKASIVAGYLRLYRFSLQMKELFDTLRIDSRVDSSDVIKLRDRIREMLKWLTNLSSSVTTNRLATVQTEVAESLEEQARKDSNVSFEFISAIETSMQESLGFIGIPMYVFAKS